MPSFRWLTLTAIILSSVGCAQISSVKPGTPLAAVEKQFGDPTTLCNEKNGTKRAVWSQQPMGHYAFATTVDTASQVGEFEQVLTDRSFDRLSEGVWTPERVQCEFGPPEKISGTGLPGEVQVVWSYRYRQYGVWYSLMYVFFGTDGKVVTQFFAGPDPMFMYDDTIFGGAF
jgi:hypothetical protein